MAQDVHFFKSKKGNWIAPAANGQLIVMEGSMTAKQVKTALEKREGKQLGSNLIAGFNSAETMVVTVDAILGKPAEDTGDAPVINWGTV